MAQKNRNLEKQSRRPATVEDNYPDVRDYALLDENEKIVGQVIDMIIDLDKDLVRYLQVYIDPERSKAERFRNLLVPTGFFRADLQNREVYLYGISLEQALHLPDYEGGPVSPGLENEIAELLTPETGKIARNPDDFYNYDHFTPIYINELE